MKLSLRNLTIDEMLSEIKRRNRAIAKLNRRRDILLIKVRQIESAIRAAGGEIKSTAKAGANRLPGKRPRNKQSLPDAISSVLSKDKPMTVAQIETAVLSKGYRTTSGRFRTIIFQALAKDKRFKKAGRGLYVLK